MISSIVSEDARRHRSRGIYIKLLAVCLAGLLIGIAAPLALPPLEAEANHGGRVLEVHPETDELDAEADNVLTARVYESQIDDDAPDPDELLTAPLYDPYPADAASTITVRFEVTQGPGNTDGNSDYRNPEATCFISPGTSTCEATLENLAGGGVDIIRAWIDEDENIATFEGDPTEGRYSGPTDCQFNPFTDTSPPTPVDEADPPVPPALSCPPTGIPVPGRDPEADSTDVVQVRWSRDPIPTTLDCAYDEDDGVAPSTGSNTAIAFACQLVDDQGQGMAGEQIDAENMGGRNDGDNAAANPADRDPFCTTDDTGRCEGTFTASEGQAGPADICFWHDSDEDNGFSSTEAPDGGDCDTEPLADNGGTTDKEHVEWQTREFRTLDAEPELMTREAGTTHTVTITAYDQFEDPYRGLSAIFLEFFQGSPNDSDGNTPNTPDTGCDMVNQPNGDGTTCTVSYVSNGDEGIDQMCAWVESPDVTPTMAGSSPNGTCSGEGRATETARSELDVVQVTWNESGVDPSPSPSPTSSVSASPSPSPSPSPVNPSGDGYWLFNAGGRVDAYGDAPHEGDREGELIGRDIVGGDSHPNGNGYWINDEFGRVYAFGASHAGDMDGQDLAAPMVGMQATPSGNGYWQVASDGGVFTHGDAVFYGSMGGQHLVAPVVGLISTPDGSGYWLIAADGGVFTFGSAVFHGSMGGHVLDQPVVGGDDAPAGNGYWLVASDGGVFTFGPSARFFGSMADTDLYRPVSGMSATPDGGGYNLVARDGGVFSHGNARFFGAGGGSDFEPMIGIENRFNDGTRPAAT